MHSLQMAAYAFGVINALACIGMFFVFTRETMSILQRLAICFVGLSAAAYLSLRVTLLTVVSRFEGLMMTFFG